MRDGAREMRSGKMVEVNWGGWVNRPELDNALGRNRATGWSRDFLP